MNWLFEKHQLGYLPGHTPDDNINIVIICLIAPNAINEMNDDIIITSKVDCVVQITDKKLNEFTTGINSYDTNPIIFKKLTGLAFETPLRFYRSSKCAFRIHKEHEIHRLIQYNSEGHLLQKGIVFNGLFTGKVLDQKKQIINCKDGKKI